MNLFALVVATSFITSLTASQNTNGETRRFLLDGLHVDKDELDKIPDFLKQIECTKCKCDHECHARDFDLKEDDVCKDFWDSISCTATAVSSGNTGVTSDHCASALCKNNGTCNNVQSTYMCNCQTGWTGNTCETKVQPQDQCATLNCHHGTCSITNGVASCTCNQGWKGNQCQTDINECTQHPCLHNGYCMNTDGTYSCSCANGWEGSQCDIDTNECLRNPCPIANATCTNTDGSYTCSCPSGWEGVNCEIKVKPQDQCAALNCLHGTCSVTNGVASCTCNQGWKGNLCQTDINECTQQPCQHNGYCMNTDGTYSCSCANGWEGNQCDKDTDECLLNPCPSANATCTNTVGSYTCSCPSGWEGVNCEIDIDECTRYRFCQNGATCVNTQGQFTCTCQSGWKGTQCQTDVDECLSNTCKHGACSNNQGSYTCTCSPGWFGVNCEKGANSTECDHICSLESAVKQVPVNFPSATCSGSSTFAPNEALLQTCCGIGDKSGWKQGEKVMTKCGTNSMNAFTPVAAYINGVIVPDTAGILTGCLHHGETGFMIIRQDCLTKPTLYHLNGTNTGIFESNPQKYYELI
ncbi:neurogenic locus notch homolog protein 1-like [Ruditapes philippinarum]|uniref:neurogenic locus notch homolog protein 1-like n=1 Tax=Ruditapes philippinarum TaxID=129788 RepID=UPI00295B91D5|nr:neurogenic locus notch homolog protein 1-like [Ruditapes philippinarum]